MNPTLLFLLATATLAAVPLANADPLDTVNGADAMRCAFSPVYVMNESVCPGQTKNKTCSTMTIFILSDNQCHAGRDVGCDGVQVFILSDNNCEGGPGANGCKGVRVIAPGSDQNCQGGDGTLDVLESVPMP